MKIEQQVTSLELSKQLKEAGVKQESLFYWIDMSFDLRDKGTEWYKPNFRIGTVETARNRKLNNENDEQYSAFLSSELGEILPSYIGKKIDKYKKLFIAEFYYTAENDKGYNFGMIYRSPDYYINLDKKEILYFTLADTEANARAKMLLYLIKNKLLSVTNRE